MLRDARQAAVASFLAVCVLAQMGFNYRDVMSGAERSALVRLQSIVTTTAATVDGNELSSVLFRHRIPDSIGHGRLDHQYEEIQSRLAKIERGNTLGTSIYTVHRTELPPDAVPDPTAPPYWIGVTSDSNPTFRKAIDLAPAMATEFEHGGVVRPSTGGTTLSAFAPIRDSKDNVVGIVVVNEDATAIWNGARWTFVANGFVYALILGVLGWVGASGYKLRALPAEKEYLQSHDPTTGLPNRSTLLVHLGSTIESAKTSGQPTGVALVCLGLDHFRHLNAEAGPRAGDDVLRTLARRLQGEAGSQSLVGRIAGDIFAVVQTGIATTDDAETYARRVLKVFEEPVRLEEQTLTVRATAGVSHFPVHAGEPGALLEAAEEALALAKQRARGQVWLFDNEARDNVKLRKTIAKHIATAIERDEFFLVYQPKVTVNSDTKLMGAEALLRWRSPELGFVGPAEFIPIAETTGVIVHLTYWVVRHVCDQVRRWQRADANGRYLKVSINLSIHMFHDPAMVDRLCEIVAKAGIPTKYVEFEITETAMGNPEVTAEKLQKLKESGFHLSIDDFGTGWSSLQRLAQMPINTLKIDRSFVLGMDKEFRNTTMVRTIVQLGQSLELEVVAEGVEEQRHLAYLREIGCDLLQGYLFDKPLEADVFQTRWLKTDKWLKTNADEQPVARAAVAKFHALPGGEDESSDPGSDAASGVQLQRGSGR
jgi:diguanylate cyclase (GGDEF)-like protein